MKKIIIFLTLAVFSIFFIMPVLTGFTTDGGDSYNLVKDVEDDTYLFGGQLDVIGDVDGDLVCAGGTINITGEVTEDLMAAGGYITLDGDVGDDIRTAGGVLVIKGEVADDLIVAGGTVTITPDAKIGGDLIASCGTLNISGMVAGEVNASAGQINISGNITGDVNITEADSVDIEDGTIIGGDLNYSAKNEANISSGADIGGKVVFDKIVEKTVSKETAWAAAGIPMGFLTASYFGINIVTFLSLFVIGLILLAVMPKVFTKFNTRMKEGLGRCVGAGAIMLFGIPMGLVVLWFIAIFLLLTIIGSGAGLILMGANVIIAILYAILIYISVVFISYLLGNTILSKTRLNFSKYGPRVLAYLIGLAIVILLYAIPFIGWIIGLAVVLFGFGALMLLMKDWISQYKKK